MLAKKIALASLASALLLTGCGSDEETSKDTAQSTTTEAGDTAGTDAPTASVCADTELALKNDGVLTVATGEPVFEPWMVDDDPSNKKGYESAVVYAVADQLGLDVEWTRTDFDAAIQPGEKDYDFNIQQYSITDERKEVVDFSDGYYTVKQAVIGLADGAIAEAATVEDLKDLKLGAMIGTTSLDYLEQYVQPNSEVAVYDDNVAVKAAFDAGQVDGVVFDLPTAYYVTAAEIEGTSIVGVLPEEGEGDELGMVFEKGSELTDCVNQALAALEADGTLAALEEEWLNQGGDIPTLTK